MLDIDVGQMPKQPRLAKIIEEYLHDISISTRRKAELRESLDDLEMLVENRTRQYVLTIEQLKDENLQRQKAEKALRKRDAILKAVSFAAEQLILNHDWQAVALAVLQNLGLATEASRAYLAQTAVGHEEELPQGLFLEWIAPVGGSRFGRLQLPASPRLGPPLRELARRRPLWGLRHEFPAPVQEFFRARGVESAAIIPILFKKKIWGVIGFEHCIHRHQWSGLELDALKTAASLLGAAIQRQGLEEVLRKSRARYRAVVDSQNEMICRFRPDGTLTFVNDAFCRYFGRERRKLISFIFFPFKTRTERSKTMQLLAALSHDSPAATMEYSLHRAGQEAKWHKWSYSRIADDAGDPQEYQAVGWDITDQKRAELQLQQVFARQEELIAQRTADLEQALNEMAHKQKMTALGILTSEIAHEINNPNSFITFNVPILKDYLQEMLTALEHGEQTGVDTEFLGMSFAEFKTDAMKLLGNIQHGSNRIDATVARLRAFARPHGANEQQMVELRSVMQRSIELCQGKINKMVKSLEFECPANLDPIYTNPHALEQILINLLINAAQSADKSNSWIRVRIFPEKPTAGYVSIQVEDNGCGMDDATRQSIFAPFFTTKARGVGTGLGLYVSQNLAREIRGYIEVESSPGNGSCFKVIIPGDSQEASKEKAAGCR